MDKKRIVAIIQARLSSSRLPGKVLLRLTNEIKVLDSVYNRIKKSSLIDDVIIATSNHESDDKIEEFCNERDYSYYRGSLEDVLERMYDAAEENLADIVIRVTGDCPLVNPKLNDELINFFINNDLDFAGIEQNEIANGLSTEIMTFNALEKANEEANPPHREHVTSYIYTNPDKFKVSRLYPSSVYKKTKNFRLTLDTKEDYEVIKYIFDNHSGFITIKNIINFLNSNPNILKVNKNISQKGLFD